MMSDREWAEDHGYYHFSCRKCGMSGWTDTVPDCACQDELDQDDSEPEEEK